ncbi:MAG: undecaprenyldiphospho-muramoylpentapeptide beta-N-acetylglucosaminyltransferase [Methylococcales bacterium]|nr:undecaprenyldiphospho-muramoylpentapeptide beta-N-acetylglucosaminyltransferase [Methylococcales bacterium]
MAQRIVIMAGGTGGHIFPALAVALFLKEKGWDVSWIGSQQGMENKIVSAQSIEIDWLPVAGIRGKGLSTKFFSAIRLIKSLGYAFKIFRHRKPSVVLGFGGYVAGPGGLVASLLNIPLVIHEQNRVVGTTNRLLSKRADKVLEAFPQSFLTQINAICTGNPLRNHFLNFPAKNIWNEDQQRNFRILIIGGSQGAKILNEQVPLALSQLKNIDVIHQTGAAAFEQVSVQYDSHAMKVQVVAFIEDIAESYQWADMIICRSGAMTVSEVAAAGLPAIFIPLPHAIDDHQTANARYLTDTGAGILLAQPELTPDQLLMSIEKIKHALKEMSHLAKSKARLDATSTVATICEEVAS